MVYLKALRYLGSFVNYERFSRYPKNSLKLERIRFFLKSLGDPQVTLKCIHIAGSKGKGSTCIFIANILRQAGYKVGLYTSPHLCDFRERVRILAPGPGRYNKEFDGMISKPSLSSLVAGLKPKLERYNKISPYGPLSFFEICTVIAFLYFKKENVDFTVLETGLGGRLDATNVVKPLVSVITPISLEHTQILGKTIAKIAGEKAGIIKTGSAVISAPQQKEAKDVIRKKCKDVNTRLFQVDKPTHYTVSLPGVHQLVNAAVAVKTIEELDLGISIQCIKKGLKYAAWPGRCEIIGRKPYIILDGAQNSASAQAIKTTVKENFDYKKLILVLGISNDKDIAGICKELSGISDIIILTKANTPRATLPGVLARQFRGKEIHKTENVKQARKLALILAGKDDLILVTGSLFVAGEFRSAEKRHK